MLKTEEMLKMWKFKGHGPQKVLKTGEMLKILKVFWILTPPLAFFKMLKTGKILNMLKFNAHKKKLKTGEMLKMSSKVFWVLTPPPKKRQGQDPENF